MLPEQFWDCSLNEIMDILICRNRKEQSRRKNKILDEFIIAEVTAANLAKLLAGNKNTEVPKPWDYYPISFKEEKEAEEQRMLEEYKERRREYNREFNRRRQG